MVKCIKNNYDALEHDAMLTGIWGCSCVSCELEQDNFEEERRIKIEEY